MSIFDFFRKKDEIVKKENYLDFFKGIPIDIFSLLWFKDGLYKNYSLHPKEIKKVVTAKVTITVTCSAEEPSAISVGLPIIKPSDDTIIQRPPYFPEYQQLSPEQRWIYIKTLKDIYNPHNDIGYIILFFYGVERHLLEGNLDSAFNISLKLMKAHKNRSFQEYVFKSLFCVSYTNARFDLLLQLYEQFCDEPVSIDANLFFYPKIIMGSPISAKELMILSSQFGFKNKLYIKKYPRLFENILKTVIIEEVGEFYIGEYVDTAELENMEVNAFANMSLTLNTQIPCIMNLLFLKDTGYRLLAEAHQRVKEQLK